MSYVYLSIALGAPVTQNRRPIYDERSSPSLPLSGDRSTTFQPLSTKGHIRLNANHHFGDLSEQR
jgi:hypothetical protein